MLLPAHEWSVGNSIICFQFCCKGNETESGMVAMIDFKALHIMLLDSESVKATIWLAGRFLVFMEITPFMTFLGHMLFLALGRFLTFEDFMLTTAPTANRTYIELSKLEHDRGRHS